MTGAILTATFLFLSVHFIVSNSMDEKVPTPNDDIITHMRRLEEKVEILTKHQKELTEQNNWLWRRAPGSPDNPATSCLFIKKWNSLSPNGLYWIKLERPVLVYCDMEAGGWMMVGSAKVTNKTEAGKIYWKPLLSNDPTKLSDVINNRFLLSSIGLQTLQSYTNFTQIRFRCTKRWHKRTVDIYTSPTPLGRSVVDAMLERISWKNRPVGCNSYLKGKADNSILAAHCERWQWNCEGKWGCGGKWGWRILYPHAQPYAVTAGIPYHQWVTLLPKDQGGVLCDDHGDEAAFSPIGEWNYYVR